MYVWIDQQNHSRPRFGHCRELEECIHSNFSPGQSIDRGTGGSLYVGSKKSAGWYVQPVISVLQPIS